MASVAVDLSATLRRYAATSGNRGRGGLSTIAGISFHLQCYLAEFAPELVRGVNLQKASNHFLEAFSDYTKPDSQRLVCVQVKRTLNNSTLAKAAEEAVVLDEFFETECRSYVMASFLRRLG